MSIKSRRFKEMDETGRAISAEVAVLRVMIHDLEVFSDHHLESYILKFFKYRTGNKPLRAYFLRKIYEYLSYDHQTLDELRKEKESRELFFIKLPFIFEMVITVQYLQKRVLDLKTDGIKGEEAIRQLLSSNILKELIYLYLDEEIKPRVANEKQAKVIYQSISKLFLYANLGQRIEKSYNNYSNWMRSDNMPGLLLNEALFDSIVHECIDPCMQRVKDEVPNKAAFIEGYFQRIYLTNVFFFDCITRLVLELTRYSGTENENVRRFTINYGFMLQIINDYADFAYAPDIKERRLLRTTNRKEYDIFTDLYNFNITLPLIFHLEEDLRQKIEAYLVGGRKKKKILTQYPGQITTEVIKSGAILKCIALSRQLSVAARNCLNQQNPVTPYLESMCNIAMNNKFYTIFSGKDDLYNGLQS